VNEWYATGILTTSAFF